MNNNPERSIILRPEAQIEAASTGAKRIVTEMVGDTLAIARREADRSAIAANARFKIDTYEWCERDYQQILMWAKVLAIAPQTVIERLLDDQSIREINPWARVPEWAGTRFEHGKLVRLHWDLDLLPIGCFELGEGLETTALSFSPAFLKRDGLIPILRDVVKEFSANCATLRYLACGHLDLGALDLACLSRLEELDCSDNRISELDLSRSPSMKVLRFYNNAIGEVDLSRLPRLESLDCGWNEIDEFGLLPES